MESSSLRVGKHTNEEIVVVLLDSVPICAL